MSDPFPELPRRVLFVDVTKPRVTKLSVTKLSVTKSASVTKSRAGRKAKGEKPMTAAERMKQYRAAKKLGKI